MKKLLVFLGSLLATFSAYGAVQTSASEFEVTVPIYRGLWEVGVTGMLLRASSSELDYALFYPNFTYEEGKYESIHPKLEFTYQVYLGYMIPCSGNDIRLSYIDYFGKKSSHISALHEGFILPNDVVLPTLSLPEVTAPLLFFDIPLLDPAVIPVNGRVREADAKNEFRMHALDLDFGQYVDIDTMVRLRFYAGVRLAKIKEKFDTHFVIGDFFASQTQTQALPETQTLISPISLTTTQTLSAGKTTIDLLTQQSSDFDGAGPRLGVEGTFFLGSGFGLIANFSTAVLIGTVQGAYSSQFGGVIPLKVMSYDITSIPPEIALLLGDPSIPVGTVFNVATPDQNISYDAHNSRRGITNLEGKIGLNYTYLFNNCRNITIEVGYFATHYFNAIDRLGWSQEFSPDLVPRHVIDLGFSGPYLSVEAML